MGPRQTYKLSNSKGNCKQGEKTIYRQGESESRSVVHQSMEFCRPEYWGGQPFPSPGDFPNPEIEFRSPTLQADFLPAEPSGKPKNTGVGSLSLPQAIFLTHESNWGLLHCRCILHQLSYQGSPLVPLNDSKMNKQDDRWHKQLIAL